ncbi:MAG TPA: molybdate ABC transporter substrate-binding protein [Kineosporiaceae bacterium]
MTLFRFRHAAELLGVRDDTVRRPALTVLAAIAALLTGCGSSSGGGAASSSPSAAAASSSALAAASSSSALSGDLTVLAAASLTGSFTQLGKQFEAAHPGTRITFGFGASSTLATQITAGAPADVFASASARSMDQVVAAKAAADPQTFAKNVMEIAVPPANPANITQLSDLARSGVKVVLCAEAVPCGSTARTVFANAKIIVKPVSDEADVKATLSKVTLGEADAGVVYVTDVLAAGNKVKGITIPADVNASTSYPIAALTASKNGELAKAFVDYVLSADGATALTQAGFAKP